MRPEPSKAETYLSPSPVLRTHHERTFLTISAGFLVGPSTLLSYPCGLQSWFTSLIMDSPVQVLGNASIQLPALSRGSSPPAVGFLPEHTKGTVQEVEGNEGTLAAALPPVTEGTSVPRPHRDNQDGPRNVKCPLQEKCPQSLTLARPSVFVRKHRLLSLYVNKSSL